MPIEVRGNEDESIKKLRSALAQYEHHFPEAQISVYRKNSVSIRVRVIDPSFCGLGRAERHDRLWSYLEKAPEALQGDISMLVLLTPDEVSTSFANLEFADPTPSKL